MEIGAKQPFCSSREKKKTITLMKRDANLPLEEASQITINRQLPPKRTPIDIVVF